MIKRNIDEIRTFAYNKEVKTLHFNAKSLKSRQALE